MVVLAVLVQCCAETKDGNNIIPRSCGRGICSSGKERGKDDDVEEDAVRKGHPEVI